MSETQTLYERGLNYIYNHFGQHLSDRHLVELRYRYTFHRPLHLDNPEAFTEKIQWLKLYDHNPLYHTMADKLKARSYVRERIGEQYLIPLLGEYDTAAEIDFAHLPEQFVLKCTHDSQSIVLCHNRDQLDPEAACARMDRAMHTDYSIYGREWVYRGLEPKIIAEPLLRDESGEELKDYKVFCFNGEPKAVELDYDRFVAHKRKLYTTDWEVMPLQIAFPDDPSLSFKGPKRLEELLHISRKLAAGTPFLRVDSYITSDQIYFGEMTFYPDNGFGVFDPDRLDYEWGQWLTLPQR